MVQEYIKKISRTIDFKNNEHTGPDNKIKCFFCPPYKGEIAFKYPELSDKQSAQEIISAFEEKQQLEDLVTETLASENNHGIQVYIGDETPVKTMKDCSVVTATYELGEGMKGTIGIIGPKRMDYEHVMKTLKTLQNELDAIYNKNPKE